MYVCKRFVNIMFINEIKKGIMLGFVFVFIINVNKLLKGYWIKVIFLKLVV